MSSLFEEAKELHEQMIAQNGDHIEVAFRNCESLGGCDIILTVQKHGYDPKNSTEEIKVIHHRDSDEVDVEITGEDLINHILQERSKDDQV